MNPAMKISSFTKAIDKSKKIPLRNNGKLEYLPIAEVLHIEAARNYSIIHGPEGKVWVSSKTLQAFEKLLNPTHQFIRLHRSHLVNKAVIIDYFYENDTLMVLLTSQKKIQVSRRQIKLVRMEIMN
jgi:two-component system LytT family response regulator